MSTLPIAYPPSRPVRPHASRPQTRSMPPSAPRPLLVACLLLLLLSVRAADAGPLAAEFLYPNFTASSYAYIDTDGAFLESSNGAFRAAIQSPGKQQHQQPASFFYLVVLHAPSGTPVWAANRDAPTGPSGRVQLTPRRLAVTDTDGRKVLWSTPTPLPSPVAALRLRDDGDLQLLDARNATLWQSFGSPTDTLLTGQQLRAGGYLSSPRSSEDFSQGDYRLAVVAASDVALTWQGSTYWRVSNDLRSFKDLNAAVAAVSFNASGLHAVAADGALVFRVDLAPAAGFRVLKLGHDGRLRVTSYAMVNSSAPLGLGGDGFVAPAGDCDLPLQCPSLGLCAAAAAGNSSTCTCPPLFAASATVPGGCTPGDGSALASPAADSCRGDYSSGAPVSYLALKSQIAYFATRFDPPTVTGVKNAACRALCTANCTCLGYFHDGSSRSCYLIGGKQLGSLYSNTRATALGYMKTFNSAASDANRKRKPSSANHILPIVLPSIAAFLLVVLVAWLWRRRRRSKSGKKSKNSAGKQLNLGHQNSRPRDASYDEDPDDEDVVIPGMPARFTYAEIASMTESFGTKVGAGGFGSVYKGELPGGGGLVAVKKLEAVGVQARREFCTEIAVIGSIRHVNLVRLRGFCAEGRRRLLVYEYMNRGSLDRPLFGSSAGPALEWGERMEVALGAARGLAYLHDGCDQKIVHCDVKPENILLADGGQVKISDFGLAKLVPPEHSAIFTTMRGTRGYLAPEWLGSAAISDRADVYSFGMVLLELVHGRKNRGEQTNYVDADVAADFRSGSSSVMTSTTSGGTGSGCGGDDYFPMVALELHEQGRYLDLVDARLEGRVSEGEVARAVRVALCCLHEDPAQRPSMAAVVRALEGSAPPPEPLVEALGFLRLYGRGYGATLPATSGSASDAAHRGSASTTTPGWLNESSHDTDTSVPS